MKTQPLYTSQQYLKKIVNSFIPRFLLGLSPRKLIGRNYWASRKPGDNHGYDKYENYLPCLTVLLSEIEMNCPEKTPPILDLGCNCGAYLSVLKKAGFSDLTGVDISKEAIEYGKAHLDLDGVTMHVGSFEEILPSWVKCNKKFGIVYTIGATIELVHPSFDIVGHICAITDDTIILFINEWGHSSPRFYEYEFNRNGFVLVKCCRPWDGQRITREGMDFSSLMVFRRVP